jgi:S-adenosylmethionine:tRNA ribosyltransferase-isomerase
MTLDRQARAVGHCRVADLPRLLMPETLLVLNNTKVRKARLKAVCAATGRGAEFLLLRRRDDAAWEALMRPSPRRAKGRRYVFADGRQGEVMEEQGGVAVRFEAPLSEAWFEAHGLVPLPPYIKRGPAEADSARYQTVYAGPVGSAAAPTAGLHITAGLLDALRRAGMKAAFITLHVGLGTFLPVRTEQVEDHLMHEEAFHISSEAAGAVEEAKAAGRSVAAVGTTSVRALESAWQGGVLAQGEQATSLFIYPGYDFKVVDAVFTNFHTPRSTLLMLVSAFAGLGLIQEGYAAAIQEGYRFFSYGDAMLIR